MFANGRLSFFFKDTIPSYAYTTFSLAIHLMRYIWVVPISFFFFFFRAIPVAYGSSWARGRTKAVAAGLHHSHSNARSQLCLRPMPQFVAVLDP